MNIDEIKDSVMAWSGFPLVGETLEELKDSLNSIQDTLSNEVSDKASMYEQIIESSGVKSEYDED